MKCLLKKCKYFDEHLSMTFKSKMLHYTHIYVMSQVIVTFAKNNYISTIHHRDNDKHKHTPP